MRVIFMSLVFSLALGASALPAWATSGEFFNENHYYAENCEVFVDKVLAYQSSHASQILTFYVKTLNDRLDAPIAEVVFFAKSWGVGYESPGGFKRGYRDFALSPFVGSKDYFEISLNLADDFGRTNYEGSFFVRTQKNTYYWFKPKGYGEFLIDLNAFDNVVRVAGRVHSYPDVRFASPTQEGPLRTYNPSGCH